MKLTIEKINSRLESRNIQLYGNYLGASIKNTFICEKKHIWAAAPSKVLQGYGCPECSGTKKLTKEIVNERLLPKKINLLGEYVSALTRTKFQCQHGHVWLAKPADVMGKSSCPSCAEYGFNLSKKAYGYILVYENFIKYGITNQLEQRLSKHIRSNGAFITHHAVEFSTGIQAKMWENSVKVNLGGNYVNKDTCPDGYTETLPTKYLNEIVDQLQILQGNEYAT
jgi:hypothetical protein